MYHQTSNLCKPLFYLLKRNPDPHVAARFDFAYDLPEGLAWQTYQQATHHHLSEEDFNKVCAEEAIALQCQGFKAQWKRDLLPGNASVKYTLKDESRLAALFAIGLQTDIWEAVRRYQDNWYVYQNGWRFVSESDMGAMIYTAIKTDFEQYSAWKQKPCPTVTAGLVNATKLALHARNQTDRQGWQECNAGIGIPFANGALVGHELITTNADFFVTNTLPHELHYTNDQPTVLLGMFEGVGLQQDEIDFIQEFAGLCLTPDMQYQRGLMLLGPPRSGKGTFCSVLRWILGDRYVSKELAKMGGQFALGNLLHKTLLAFEDERGKPDASGVSRVLKIIGGDPIDFEQKNKDARTEALECKVILIANAIPQIPDESGAVAARFGMIRTRESFVGREDPTLLARILEQEQEILSWAVRGLWRLRNRGNFVPPQNDEHRHYAVANSPLRTFLNECTKPGNGVEKDDLYMRYEEFARDNDLTPVGKNMFFREIRQLDARLTEKKVRVGEGRQRIIQSISLR